MSTGIGVAVIFFIVSMSTYLFVGQKEVAKLERTEQKIQAIEVEMVEKDEALVRVEEELIRFALKFYRGQMSQVARKLGIGRSTLYRKLKDYGIDPDDPLKEAA